ncbi:hypothetical protein BJX62DRAFT_245306 [Aspergillus germanicus]
MLFIWLIILSSKQPAPGTSRDGLENQEECAECGLVGHGPEQCPLGMMALLHSALTARARRERRMRLNQTGSKKPRAQQSAVSARNHGAAKQSPPSKQPDSRYASPKEPVADN